MAKYLTDTDLYMCKHATTTTDKDGFCVPACTLCNGMACEMVLHYGDEGCKYEPEEPHENIPLFDDYEKECYDR